MASPFCSSISPIPVPVADDPGLSLRTVRNCRHGFVQATGVEIAMARSLVTLWVDRVSRDQVLGEFDRLVQSTKPPRDLDGRADDVEIGRIQREPLLEVSCRRRKVPVDDSLRSMPARAYAGA